MDDDMCIKSGLVKTGGCECASTLGLVNLYSAASRVCRECIQVGKFAHLIKNSGPVKRSLK